MPRKSATAPRFVLRGSSQGSAPFREESALASWQISRMVCQNSQNHIGAPTLMRGEKLRTNSPSPLQSQATRRGFAMG